MTYNKNTQAKKPEGYRRVKDSKGPYHLLVKQTKIQTDTTTTCVETRIHLKIADVKNKNINLRSDKKHL